MSHQTTLLINFFVSMLAITNPIGNLAIFIGLVADKTKKEKQQTAITSTTTITTRGLTSESKRRCKISPTLQSFAESFQLSIIFPFVVDYRTATYGPG